MEEIINDDLFKEIEMERDSFLYHVRKGVQGYNTGIKCALPELNKYLHGIQKGEYYLIGSESGAGKTTFTDYYFIFTMYEHCKINNIPFLLMYYSFEISKADKMAKFAAYVLWKKYQMRIPTFKILGKDQDDKLTREELEKIIEVSASVDQFFKDIIFIDESTNPTGIYKDVLKELNAVGKFHYEQYTDGDGKVKEKIVGFEYYDNKQIFMVCIDHISQIHTERGFTLKESMDKTSEYMVYFRNRCNITPVIIQQFSTDLISTHRKQQTEDSIAPTRIDFSDSKYLYRDATVVLSPVDPVMYDLSKMDKYKMGDMNDKYRSLFLIKHRNGTSNIRNHLLMDPITNTFIELRKTDITNDYLTSVYEAAKTL